MVSEYRRRFGDYHAELNREDYLFRSGRKDTCDTYHLHGEYSDLFSKSTIEELRSAHNSVSEDRPTERESIRRLISFAVRGNIDSSLRELTEEIGRYKASARIDWDGAKIGFRQSLDLLAGEPEAGRRRDLYARRSEVIKASQDLYAEHLDNLNSAISAFGYEDYIAFCRSLNDVDYEKGAGQALSFLSATEGEYVSSISAFMHSETSLPLEAASPADLAFIERFTRFDRYFGAGRMKEIYSELFSGLGFKTESQQNILIDAEPRPGKQAGAFCSPVRVPGEVKLVVNLTGGQWNYREFLCVAGRAQQYAWTSQNLYPEFRFVGGDNGVSWAWGMLFESLLMDENWLMGTFGFAENRVFTKRLWSMRLARLRRASAVLNYGVEYYTGRSTGNAASRYADLMTDASRVRYDESEYLSCLSDGIDSAAILRAAVFESQLREYLKSKYGLRWWVSAKAGDMLIDLWNTGQRHRLEDLALLIGLGELDINWLSSELVEKVRMR